MVPGNTAPLGIAILGLLLGMRHATDPDHIIAVTAILSRERRLFAATRIGVVWGLGHTLTVLAVGAAIIVFKFAVPVRLGLAMEFAVAITLILLGLGTVGTLIRRTVARVFGTSPDAKNPGAPLPGGGHDLENSQSPRTDDDLIVHSHTHVHGGASHRHPHVHGADGEFHREHVLVAGASSPLAARHPLLRSFGVGLVHGLAGSAAIALLVLSAIPGPLWATLYLMIFCIGTIIGMGLITTAIATPMIVASRRMSSLHQRLVIGSGLLSFGFGLFLAYQIGIVDRLFDTAPIWIPH